MAKELDLTPIYWVQEKREIEMRNRKAEEYSQSVAKEKRHNVMISITFIILTIICIIGYGGMFLHAMVKQEKCIIRYGYVETCDNGDVVIATEDGNLWIPSNTTEYDNGTELCVIFDGKGTEDATDDVIVHVIKK